MGGLGPQPITIGETQIATQTKVRICTDGTLAHNDGADPLRRDANLLGQAVLGDPHGLEELLCEKFSRGDGLDFPHNVSSSVVVHNLDIRRSGLCPAKADSPLIIDANAVLAGSISTKWFQAIARRDPTVFKAPGDLQLTQLAASYGLDVHETPRPIPGVGFFYSLVTDHFRLPS
ncbi:MAG: hypothetical protein WBN82_06975 [Porticoccaceae bacterium]